MNYILLVPVAAVIILIVFIMNRKNDARMKAGLRNSIGKRPSNKDYGLDSMAVYHYYAKRFTDTSGYIDEITWNDLDMDKIYKRLNTCITSVGEEYLYHMLHVPKFNENELTKRERLIDYFDAHSEQRYNIQLYLAKLGKMDYNGVASYIFDADSQQLKYPYIYMILMLIPLLCIASMFYSLAMGISLLIISLMINTFVYVRIKITLESRLDTIRYFAGMLWSCKKILGVKDEQLVSLMDNLRQSYPVFRRYGAMMSRSMQKMGNEFDVFVDYIRIITFGDVRKYNAIVNRMVKHRDSLRVLYEALGEIDAALCILSFRRSVETFCAPQFAEENSILFDGVYHPLLEGAVKNSGKIARNSIVTGPNASGKSTFIKALAVNSILAQTINTCTADRFVLRHSLVMTSMAVRDDITKGESYFITEIKSLKRIMDKIEQMPCTCFIDEILRGTNTIERIAASASILKYLDVKDCLSMIASHDIELTRIMEKFYDNYHFTEKVTDDGIIFDYKLHEGSATSRNAIKLLGVLGYDKRIVEDAENSVDVYMETKNWDNI